MEAGDNTPVHFGEVAIPLIEGGWRPIPLRPDTKIPADLEWSARNHEPWPAREIGLMVRQFGDCACGIALQQELFVVDIDILDEFVVAAVLEIARQHFGATPLQRIGLAPKVVLIYRSDGSTQSKKPHPIELFSGSGQVAVFGIHSKTGRPYHWLDHSPLTLAVDSPEIPLVTGSEQRAFLQAVGHITAPRKTTRRTAHAGRSPLEANDPGHYMRLLLTRGIRFAVAARHVLDLADIGQRHACVRAVISAGFNVGLSADVIEQLIHRHASDDTLRAVEQDGYMARTLRDFTPTFKDGARQ